MTDEPRYQVAITCPDGVVVDYEHVTLRQVTGSVEVWATEPGYSVLVVREEDS